MNTRDGRQIDGALGILKGEGAGIEVKHPEEGFPAAPERRPAPMEEEASPAYYDQPAIHEPDWGPSIPLYFYVGGLAGASAALGAAAQLAGGEELRPLVRKCRWIAALGTAASGALLIEDLGRPSRFLHMLRVFRPSSPMNVGTWILSAAGSTSGAAAVLPGRIGDAAGIAAGIAGLPLSGYTAVLVTNTAVPVWQGIRRTLPFFFVAGAMSSAGSMLSILELPQRPARVARTFGAAGKALELAAGFAVEREAARNERVARPLKTGFSGALFRASKWGTAASLALDLLPTKNRQVRVAAGIIGTAAAIASRFAILRAGVRSARDPRATFEPQRQGLGAAEVTGVAGVTGPSGIRATGDHG